MKIRTVYGVSFKSLSELVKLLGYKKALNITTINKQYGGLESLVQKRFGLTDENEIRKKLIALKEYADNNKIEKIMPDSNAEKIAAAFIRSKLIDISENELANVARLLGISISNTEIQDIKKLLKDFSLNFQADDMKIALRW